MGIFGGKKFDIGSMFGGQTQPAPSGGNPMAAFGGYNQNAAMQGQSGFAPMNAGAAPKKPSF